MGMSSECIMKVLSSMLNVMMNVSCMRNRIGIIESVVKVVVRMSLVEVIMLFVIDSLWRMFLCVLCVFDFFCILVIRKML